MASSKRKRHHELPPQQPEQYKIKVKLKNEQQEQAWDTCSDNVITFLTGPAGTAKTFVATLFAVMQVLDGSRQKIVITRPAVEAGENLGFLPGTPDEKLDPFVKPVLEAVEIITGGDPGAAKYIAERTKIIPLAFIRGRTIGNAVAILDEAQNATKLQLKTYLTRLGWETTFIICGDDTQSDLSGGSWLSRVARANSKIDGVGWFEFTKDAIVRPPLVGKVLEAMESI